MSYGSPDTLVSLARGLRILQLFSPFSIESLLVRLLRLRRWRP